MKNVLILGARSDIAQALARRFALRNCSVTLAARNAGSLAAHVNDLKIRSGAEACAVEFDALQYETHETFYDSLSCRPDVVVCVFGYLGDTEKARHDAGEARRVLESNFNGAVSVLDLVADEFEKRGNGAIVGIGSVAGDRGRQSNYHYGSAKAGFAAYLSGLRNRLSKSGVQVLTVKPGFVRTKMTEGMDLPPLLTAEPDQVARDIMRGLDRKRNVIYSLWLWRWVMLMIRMIPEPLFKKLSL